MGTPARKRQANDLKKSVLSLTDGGDSPFGKPALGLIFAGMRKETSLRAVRAGALAGIALPFVFFALSFGLESFAPVPFFLIER